MARNNRYLPSSLLGWKYTTWREFQLRFILEFYGYRYGVRANKIYLYGALCALTNRRSLTRADRLEILSSRRSSRRSRRSRQTADASQTASDTRSTPQNHSDLSPRDTVSPTASPGHSKQCVVCDETLDEDNRPNSPVSPKCQHDIEVCRECLMQSITAQSSIKTWDQIQCPSCNVPLDYYDMQAHADKDTFDRYLFNLQSPSHGS